MNITIVINEERKKEGAKKNSTRRRKEENYKKNKSENCKTYYNGYYVDERGIRMFHGRSKNSRRTMRYYKKAVRSRLNNVYRIEEDFNLPKNSYFYKKIYSNGFTY